MQTQLTQFQDYLLGSGFTLLSSIDYAWRISKIAEKEGITLESLSKELQRYLQEYGRQGQKWMIGKKSHASYYNALKQFRKFVLVQRFGGVNG